MDWAYLLFSFHGRISRKMFWIAMGAVGVANFLACYFAEEMDGVRLSAIVDLAFTYPEFAIAAKRGNDRNSPIWPLAIFFAANAVLDLIDVAQWGGTRAEPSTLSLAIAVPFTAFLLLLLVELGFRKGTLGPNQYGPDPLARS